MATKTTDWRPGPTVCRCCLSEGCYKDISTEYFWMGKREVYAEMLLDTLSLSIAYSQSGPNSNSRLICEPCISRLRDASDFRRQVQECEKTFMQYLDPGSSALRETEASVCQLETQVKVESVKEEKQGSDDEFVDRGDFAAADEEDDDDLDDQPLTKLASKIPKKEAVDLLDLLDNAKAGEKRKSTTKTKSTSAKKAKSKKEAKATSSKATKPEKKKKVPSKVRPVTSIWSMTLMERENAAILLQLTTVRPFTYMSFPLRFKCFYCEEIHPELETLLKHTGSHKVPSLTEMLKGLLKKGKKTIKVDISELKCKLCSSPFPNVDDARSHLSANHGTKFNNDSGNGMMVYSLKTKDGVFSCHLCTQTFTSFFLLNKHINVHFNNAICEWCGKGFISHQRLIQHKEIHLKGKFYCEKCKQSFESPAKFKYHKNRLHGKPNKVYNIYNCQYCSIRFDHHYEKMRHISESHGINFEYTCETCNAVFKTRKSLASHRVKYHIQNIACEICKKPFAKRGHLKNHMAMHTEERNFACPLCNKTYKYEKNVKAHMRVHNPDWKFACAECWIGFPNKIEFRKHAAESHPVSV